MDEKVPDVVTIVENNNALPDRGYCFKDASFGDGEYTGQRGTTAGMVVRHGYGRMDFTNGDWYQGDWVMNCMQGTGCFYHKRRNYGYEGEFSKDCAVDGTYYFGNLTEKIYFKSNVVADAPVTNSAFWLAVYLKYQQVTANKKVPQTQKVNALLAELSSLY
jgi:hypothetical protein